LKTPAQAREQGIRLAGKEDEAGNAIELSMQPDDAERAKNRSKPAT
jgi:hypothetical protein